MKSKNFKMPKQRDVNIALDAMEELMFTLIDHPEEFKKLPRKSRVLPRDKIIIPMDGRISHKVQKIGKFTVLSK